jgi:hypothetical protein
MRSTAAATGPPDSHDRTGAGRGATPEDAANDQVAAGTESLLGEIQAARDAAAAHLSKVAATASGEVQISIASAVAMASATLLSVAFLIVAWVCIVGLGVWIAVSAGSSMTVALGAAAVMNILAALVCRFWYARLGKNIGFSRTRKLLFG